ncbi:hypothetical protein O6H91_17G031600 [Diphasiastrum complanatum]|uniref:Uncharacterized protein n=1 Tax=Diphasiastrum complanatum TaxID=34168 RepID=A0ACC2B5D0_DIPCM|nr:hypothetical protein O6H91_17G031600 [Diphasiastrum complanatum]
MPTYKIGGIDVEFPYDAYDCQLVYMERVIFSLQKCHNALLESPTGTGKTLCLLCATLAWRKYKSSSLQHAGQPVDQLQSSGSSQFKLSQSPELVKPRMAPIIYASRTHSQLQQVIRELKATVYRPKMVVLGSREQMCIHKDVRSMNGRAQTHACRSLCKSRSCSHYLRVADYLRTHPELGEEPIDIEDLVNIGKSHGPCPYFVSRELHNSSDILFLPYNYLIDKENRRSLSGIQWADSIIIFDEAHNLEGICADSTSFDLSTTHLASCILEAKQCIDLALVHRGRNNAVDRSVDPENFAVLKALLFELEKNINEVPLESKELGFTKPGPYIYEFLSSMNITYETVMMLIDTVDYATDLLEDESSVHSSVLEARPKTNTYRLQALRDALQLVFRGNDPSHAAFYRVHIHESYSRSNEKAQGRAEKTTRTLSWWCFNPGLAMQEFAKMGVRSIILTSGTLSPLDSFALELNLPFEVQLENPHVIGTNQLWVGVVPSGPSGKPLNSSYRMRDSVDYKLELGNAIVNFARIVPDGLLVFFPSYYLLNSCIDTWQTSVQANTTSVWERICKHKQPVVEPKESALFNQINEDFLSKLNDSTSSGAVFFAVCRGKVSEGLDFSDRAGRAVVITGMPFAMKTDPKVRLKRQYLDDQARSQRGQRKILTGEEWYVQQAARAVNQAVGRIIRHKADYGAIILCDERYAQSSAQSQMSLWLRPHIKCYSKFGDATFTLTRFFREKEPMRVPQKSYSIKKLGDEAVKVSNIQLSDTKAALFSYDISPAQDAIGTLGGDCETDILRRKTTSPLGGAHVFSLPQQPLSAILAASRSKPAMQDICAIDIAPAHCAVGSNVATLRHVSTSTMMVLARKGQADCKFSPTIHNDIVISGNNHESGRATISTGSFNCPLSASLTESISSPPSEPGVLQTSYSDDQNNCLPETNVATQDGEKSADLKRSIPSQDKRSASAAEFLKEVKARLSIIEYGKFLECMRSLKQQTTSMDTLLRTVANLFSAPERMFLLSRFGSFVPAQHQGTFDNYFAFNKARLERINGITSIDDKQECSKLGNKLGTRQLSKLESFSGFPCGSRKKHRLTIPKSSDALEMVKDEKASTTGKTIANC